MAECDDVRETLRTLIVWMAQSTNSPISVSEAEILLRKLDARTGTQKDWKATNWDRCPECGHAPR